MHTPLSSGSMLAHPIVIFVGIWSTTFLLYSLGLSEQLIFNASDFAYVYTTLIGSFLAGYFYTSIFTRCLPISNRTWASDKGIPGSHDTIVDRSHTIWNRIKLLFLAWAGITALEIVVSGGLPIIWLLTGSAKTYRDFGLPSLHGFLMSVILACSALSFYMFLTLRQTRYLAIPVFSLIWFTVTVTRNYLIGDLLQMLFLFLALRRPSRRQITRIVCGVFVLVVFFGFLGDLRSGGSDLIRAVGRPTDRFPDWLPTGFLWAYIYLTTPLNNLFNTITLNPSIEDFSLVASTSQLLPTFIRVAIFPQTLSQGDLVDENLNVSTGFVGPYTDMGLFGIGLFGALIGILANVFWSFRQSLFFLLGYLYIAQAMVLSIFFNQVLFLPYLFQLFWFWLLLRGKARINPRAAFPALNTP
jgi:oligosaccharide repeat unit polymerase